MDTKEKAEQKGTRNPNPHDVFAKEMLSYQQNAVDFFTGILPTKLQANLQLQTIEADKTSYSDEKLKEYFSDVVYSCACRHNETTVKLSLLFEHKSSLSEFPYGQLLRYISLIWDLHEKQKQPLPVVLPILFYHGKLTWKQRPLYSYLAGDSELYDRFIPEFEYLLINLREYPDELILKTFGNNPGVKLWLFIQKYIFTPAEVLEQLENLTESDKIFITSEEGIRIWETICRYLFAATFIKPEDIVKTVNTLPKDAKEAMMTTAEWLRQEGLERGVIKGLKQAKTEDAQRMLDEGLDIELIVRVTGLSREEVERLR